MAPSCVRVLCREVATHRVRWRNGPTLGMCKGHAESVRHVAEAMGYAFAVEPIEPKAQAS
jgi:hypothetical protein